MSGWQKKMKKFGYILLTFYWTGWGMAIASLPARGQSGNQSDITGPNPVEIITNPDPEEPITETRTPPTNTPNNPTTNTQNSSEENSNNDSSTSGVTAVEVDRLAYETQLQQSSTGEAIQLLEEYQALDFCNYLKLEQCGKVPTLEQLVGILNQAWQETGEKSVFIYITSSQKSIDILAIFPTDPNLQKQSFDDREIIDKAIVRSRVPNISNSLIRETVKKLRRDITNIRRTSPSYLSSAQKLYQWIVAPLTEELKEQNIDTLVFSLDTGLRLIPMSALHDGENFLIENYNVAIVPSFGLVDLGYSDIRTMPLLAMGATQFTNQAPLPAVELELEAIAQNSWESKIFVDSEFTVTNFMTENLANPFGIIHLATHGEFKSGDVENSYIQFADRPIDLFELRQIAQSLGWTDGDRPLIELFVLSACQTAVGNESAELGFAGLAIQLGVKSVVASLWRVSDIGTLALMGEYYQQLARSPIKARALRLAQLKLLTGETYIADGRLHFSNGRNIVLPPELRYQANINLTHPFFWSSFMTVGNWN